jgi:arginine exporter protein ArgO
VLAGAAIAALIGPYGTPLRLLSAAVLVAIAVRGLLAVRRGARPVTGADGSAAPSGPGAAATYAKFLGLTIINPMTVIYFAALVLGLPAIGSGAPDRIAFVVAAFLASLSWQLVIAAFGAVVHHRLPAGAATVTSIVGNIIVLLFAAGIALNA